MMDLGETGASWYSFITLFEIELVGSIQKVLCTYVPNCPGLLTNIQMNGRQAYKQAWLLKKSTTRLIYGATNL